MAKFFAANWIRESVINDGGVADFSDTIGSVDDPEDNLDFYTLSCAAVATSPSADFARGTSEVVAAPLGSFDPTPLRNDSYEIQLTAQDLNGQVSIFKTVIGLDGNARLGNFRLKFSDLSIPLAGIPIQVSRVYDTLL